MKKHSTSAGKGSTVGMDLGDKFHAVCELDEDGEIICQARISATMKALERTFKERETLTIAMETGTHSPWISRALESWGHHVLVANARKLRAIYTSPNKDDDHDAEMLARLARADPKLLSPIHHRSRRTQTHRAALKSRDILVKARATLINHARGVVKSLGERLPKCTAPCFHKKAKEHVPKELHAALDPILQTIEELTDKIKNMDRELAKLCSEEYPETEFLRSVVGVGPITALAFVVTIEEPERFANSRDVPAFLGLLPRKDKSGESDKQLGISKHGDRYLRRLLVQCAQYILGNFGPDSDLRRWGLAMCERGGKNAKKRAIVAVARKLSVILHCLWKRKEHYEPFHYSSRTEQNAAA